MEDQPTSNEQLARQAAREISELVPGDVSPSWRELVQRLGEEGATDLFAIQAERDQLIEIDRYDSTI